MVRVSLRTLVLLAVGSIALAGVSPTQAGEFRFVPDVAYLEPARTQKLDLYLPTLDPAAPLAPALVWIHGNRGDKGEKRGKEICETLAASGYVCVSINYGPDGQLENNIRDSKNAVRFLRAHAAEYHIDPSRIAIGGGSAGGYLSLMAAFTVGNERFEPTAPYPGVSSAVRAIVDFYGPLGPPNLKTTHFIPDNAPPLLILHGQMDRTVPGEDSVDLAAALKKKNIEHQLIILPGIGHTFRLTSTWDDKPLPQDLRPVLLEFLQKHLRPLAK